MSKSRHYFTVVNVETRVFTLLNVNVSAPLARRLPLSPETIIPPSHPRRREWRRPSAPVYLASRDRAAVLPDKNRAIAGAHGRSERGEENATMASSIWKEIREEQASI